MWRVVTIAVVLSGAAAFAEGDGRPDESELFGAPAEAEGSGVDRAEATSPEAGGRPDEADLFGGGDPGTTNVTTTATATATATPAASRDGISGIIDRFATDEAKDDPLDIGGLFYQQLTAMSRAGQGLGATQLSAPTIVDAYLDARPNDRLRANITARLRYDALQGDASELASSFTGASQDNPSIALDQLWLRFDILRTVFVTAGKQHVKWGTARFWNPTDFLHPQRRDSLALFDVRTGTNMVKFHVPWEATGANFYAVALLDDFPSGTAGTFGGLGGALRAEWVLGTAEFGVDAMLQNNRRPRYGFDFSSALGPFDVYGEAALRAGPYSRFQQVQTPFGPSLELQEQGDRSVSAAGGLTWTFAYTDNDTATVGVEYFYNQPGYENSDLYMGLLVNRAFQPLYTGQHYAAFYALVPGPGSWDDTNIIVSNLGNLSDRSFVARLDVTQRVLSYLTVEANVSAYYGNPNGEFRLRLDLPSMQRGDEFVPGFTVPEQRFSAGLALRMEI